MREQSRLTLVRGGFILVVLLFIASGVLIDTVTGLVQPLISAGHPLVWPNMSDPMQLYAAFPEAGLLVALGAFLWCLAARRAPYLQRMAILFGVALVASLGIAVTFRWEAALGYAQVMAITGSPPMMTIRPIAWVPLGGGIAALGVGAIMGLAGYLSRRARMEPQARDSQ
jgi:hypothetical protein